MENKELTFKSSGEMKKKEYMTPSLVVVEIAAKALLMASGVESEGIGFGGVDENGSIEPTAPIMTDEIDW